MSYTKGLQSADDVRGKCKYQRAWTRIQRKGIEIYQFDILKRSRNIPRQSKYLSFYSCLVFVCYLFVHEGLRSAFQIELKFVSVGF